MTFLLAGLSSVLWGIADFLGGVFSRKMNVSFVLLVSQFFGLLSVVIYSLLTGELWVADALPYASLAGITGLLGLAFFYTALSTGPMGIVSPIAALGAIVPVAYGFSQGEAPSQVQWIGIIVAIVGVTLASGPEISGTVGARPIVLSALAAVSFGSCLIFLAKGGAFSVTTTAIGMRIQSVVILLLVVVIAKSFSSTNPTDWLWLAVIGVFDIGANISLTVAAQTGYLSLVGMLGSLYPVVTVLLARFVLQERLKGIQYYGVAIALGGVVAIAAG
ncbi:MAG: hypothetical protein RIS09_850 [Actinomycetota bacterium]